MIANISKIANIRKRGQAMKEKQIEEMCKIMRCVDDQSCANTPMCPESHDICDRVSCRQCKEARLLLDAGYRKQSEGEWISLESQNEPFPQDHENGCEYCKGRAYTKKPLTVITRYGRKIELVFEYCPKCGRKMKGE
jgi:hypothetical protein